MNVSPPAEPRESSSTLTIGITDLMTSLAVIFILLFSAYVTKVSETESEAKVLIPALPQDRQVARTTTDDIKRVLRDHFQRFDLSLDPDPIDPSVVRIVVPDALLNFEFGKASSPPWRTAFSQRRCRAMRCCCAAPYAIESIHW